MPRNAGNARVVLTAEEKAFVRGMKRSESAIRDLNRRNERLERQMRRTNTQLSASVGNLRAFAAAGGALGVTFGAAGLIRGFGSVVTAAGEFEAAMLRVSAAGGSVGADLAELTRAAERLGATTEFTAVQAAMGLELLQRAGLTAAESIVSIPRTLDLASAAGLDLASATDIAVTSLSALGRGVDDLPRFLDVLAKAAASANTTVPQLGEAVGAVGAIAVEAGVGVNEMVAALTLLQARGRTGTQAGTDLRGVILALLAPTGEAADTLERLGVNTRDAEGNFRGLTQVMSDLNDAAPDAADLNRIFGLIKVTPAAILKNLSDTVLPDLTASLNDSTGALQRMVDTMRQGLNFELKVLESSASAAAISVGNRLAPATGDVVRQLTVLLQLVAALTGENKNIERTAAAMNALAESTSLARYSMDPLTRSFKGLSDLLAPGLFESSLEALEGVFSTFALQATSTEGSVRTVNDALDAMNTNSLAAAEALRQVESNTKNAGDATEPIVRFTTDTLPALPSGLIRVAESAERIEEAMKAAARATGLVRTASETARIATEEQLRAALEGFNELFDTAPQRTDQILRRPIAEALAGLAPQVDAAEASARVANRELTAAQQLAISIGQDLSGGFASAVEGAQQMNTLLRATLSTAIRIGETLLTSFLSGRGLFGNIPGRQFGGNIQSGRPYIVGERGPELVVPRHSGTVIPNGQFGGVSLTFAPVITASDSGTVGIIRNELAQFAGEFLEAAKAELAADLNRPSIFRR